MLTTVGRLTHGICRCQGGPTLVLRGHDDGVLGSASLHRYGRVSWDRPRFGNDLDVADPTGLLNTGTQGGSRLYRLPWGATSSPVR
jgi:hypothetical protein